MTSAVDNTSNATNQLSSDALTKNTGPQTAEQFLKLLVTQLQNQDPLSPMDNAELTSQIAQINTVTGVTNLNTSVQGLQSQFVQMQALQGASLVGKDVIVPGNKVDIDNGVGQGGFKLDSAADNVTVDILNAAGAKIDTVQLGAQSAGMNGFQWNAGKYDNTSGLTFKVTATSGSTPLTTTALMRDQVEAVTTAGGQLQLILERSGQVPYSQVAALN